MDSFDSETPDSDAYIFWVKDRNNPDAIFGAGSGFMVTGTTALTARHVVASSIPHLPENDWPVRSVRELLLIAGADEYEVKNIIPHPRLDIAILVLNKTWKGPCATLVDGLEQRHFETLQSSDHCIDAIGFSRFRDGDGPHGGRVTLHPPGGAKDPDNVQFIPSQPKGLSGGPLRMRWQNKFLVLGLNYLGGDGAATSRAYLSPVLHKFLRDNGYDVTAENADIVIPNITNKTNKTQTTNIIHGNINGPVGDNNNVTYNFNNKGDR